MSLDADSIIEGTTAGVVASVLLGTFALLRNRVRNIWLRYKIHRSLRLVGYGTSLTDVTINLQNRTGTDIIVREVVITTEGMEYLLNPTGEVSSSFPSQYARLTRAYGQPGGGVEVIFVNGSPDKTVTGPVQIPP